MSDDTIVPVEQFVCPRCQLTKPKNLVDPHMCEDCAKVENVRITHIRQHQDWLTVAQESGIDPWAQQPGETQWEYTVWVAYRDSYPGKKPTYASVALELDTTYAAVKKVSQRWTFPVRMQLWMKHIDEITLLQRRDEILAMNKSHIDLATKIRGKVDKFIDSMNVEDMKPGEMVQMLKLAAELEKQARVDTISQDEMRAVLIKGDENPDLKKAPTEQKDLKEVMDILLQAGALGNITHVGVKQTTEVVMMDDQGTSASLTTGNEITDGES